MTPRKTTDLTYTLVAGMKEMISGGTLHRGGRVPPERELAKKFGVNRASVRQALKALDVMGVLHQRVGDGTYLTQDASTTLGVPLEFLILVDGITMTELLEARLIVEPALAAMAASRASDQDVDRLIQASLEVEASLATRAADIAEKDLAFHELVWNVAGNRLCERMFAAVHRAMFQIIEPSIRAVGPSELLQLGHRRIVDAIRQRDDATAKQSLCMHLHSLAEFAAPPPPPEISVREAAASMA